MGRPDFAIVAFHVAHRRVSEPEDEALVVATLLGLDSEAVAASPKNERRQQLWKLMPQAYRGIPKTIIFNNLSRLNSAGLR